MPPILFYLFATLAVLGALGVIINRNPVSSAFSLIACFVSIAALFVGMNAYFIGTIQVLVYTGAIMVLFVFSIMLLNLKKLGDRFAITSPRFLIGAVCGLAIVGAGTLGILQWIPQNYGTWDNQAMLSAGGNTRILAHSLFTQHAIAFEAVSVALIVALVGAVTLAKRKFE